MSRHYITTINYQKLIELQAKQGSYTLRRENNPKTKTSAPNMQKTKNFKARRK